MRAVDVDDDDIDAQYGLRKDATGSRRAALAIGWCPARSAGDLGGHRRRPSLRLQRSSESSQPFTQIPEAGDNVERECETKGKHAALGAELPRP